MKKRWVYLLAMLLVVALTAFGAVAEMAEDAEISFEENVSGILPEDIEMSEDALEIPDDELDVEMQEEEDIQLESLELSELDEPAVTEEAALVDNEEGQTAPGTGESASSSTDDFETVDGVLVKYKGAGGDAEEGHGLHRRLQEQQGHRHRDGHPQGQGEIHGHR